MALNIEDGPAAPSRSAAIGSGLSGAEPWERQEHEGKRAFAAFVAYRDLPARTRSVVAAYRQVTGRAQGEPPGQWTAWSSENGWVRRAMAWDAEQDRRKRDHLAEEIIEMAERQARISAAFLDKVVARLEVLEPADLSPSDLIRWFEVAAKVERLARGLPAETTRQEQTGPGGAPIQHDHQASLIDLNRLSLQQLEWYEEIIKAGRVPDASDPDRPPARPELAGNGRDTRA